MEISPSTLRCLILRFLCTSNLPQCEKQESYSNFQLLGNISECQLIPLHKDFHTSTVCNQERVHKYPTIKEVLIKFLLNYIYGEFL